MSIYVHAYENLSSFFPNQTIRFGSCRQIPNQINRKFHRICSTRDSPEIQNYRLGTPQPGKALLLAADSNGSFQFRVQGMSPLRVESGQRWHTKELVSMARRLVKFLHGRLVGASPCFSFLRKRSAC